MGNIVYKIDENGERASKNWTGRFRDDSSDDNVWIYINDEEGKNVPLEKGDHIHYSDADLTNNGDYEIEQAEMGIYKVKRLG